MDMHELKPCPFCGSQPITFNTGNAYPEIYYRVICPNNCCMQSKLYDSLADAIEAWNRRANNDKR